MMSDAAVDGDGLGPVAVTEVVGSMTLCPVPESVPRARRWFRKLTEHYALNCSLDDCVVMISELVTNAVLYGEPAEHWRVRVEWLREGDALRVDVHSPGAPALVRMRERTVDATFGRGLHLVDAMSDSWTVGRSPYGGTMISFTLEGAWKT